MASAALSMMRKIVGGDADGARAHINDLKDSCLRWLAQIEVLQGQKLTVGTWEEAEALEHQIRKLKWQIESAERKIPAAEQRLAALQAVERQELLASLMKPWAAAHRSFSANAKVARHSFDDLVRIIDSLRSNGFEQQAQALIVKLPPHIAGSPLLNDAALADHPPAVRTSAPAPKATKPAAKPRAGAVDSQRRISSADIPQSRERKPRPLRNDPPPTDGSKTLVRYIRASCELPSGELSRVGDVLALDHQHAAALVRNGACDYIEQPANSTGG